MESWATCMLGSLLGTWRCSRTSVWVKISCFVALALVCVVAVGTSLRPKARILAARGDCRRHHRIRRSGSDGLGLKGGPLVCCSLFLLFFFCFSIMSIYIYEDIWQNMWFIFRSDYVHILIFCCVYLYGELMVITRNRIINFSFRFIFVQVHCVTSRVLPFVLFY